MGFYLKKSIKFGGLRFNFSKSGVGVSAGFKGFRIGAGPRGNYIHMGRNGIYYRAALGKTKKTNIITNSSYNIPSNHTKEELLFTEIESKDTSYIVDSSSQDIVNEINKNRKKISLWPLALLFAFVPKVGIFIFPVLIFMVYLFIDKKRKTTVLFYDIENESEQDIQNFYVGFDELISCNMKWHVTAQANIHNRKYYAGAGQLIQRTGIIIKYSTPPYIKTNVRVPCVPAKKQKLYFFPDKILIYNGKKVGGVSYNNLFITQNGKQFIESGIVPQDGTIVDYTWRYVNKSGGPDKRFANNRKLPILDYSELYFKSDSGLNELIHLSKQGTGTNLINCLRKYQVDLLEIEKNSLVEEK